MKPVSLAPAAIAQPTPREFELSGYWTALGIGAIDRHLEALMAPEKTEVVVDGTGVEGLDTVGVWIVQKLLQQLPLVRLHWVPLMLLPVVVRVL